VVLDFSKLPVLVLKQIRTVLVVILEPVPNIIYSYDLAFANCNQQTEYPNNTG
jgi:hypothetical protein